MKKTIPADMSLLRPVPYQQLVPLELPRDLKAGMRRGFPPPPDEARERAWHQFVRDYATGHGWSKTVTDRVHRAIRMLLGMQDTPGAAIKDQPSPSIGLLAVERKATGDVIGYCGLIDSGRGSEGEPELAFELLRRVWRQGYATEASFAVVDWARSSGYRRLWATVWEWNAASRRVLAKLGFTETTRKEVDAVYGTTLFTTRRL